MLQCGQVKTNPIIEPQDQNGYSLPNGERLSDQRSSATAEKLEVQIGADISVCFVLAP